MCQPHQAERTRRRLFCRKPNPAVNFRGVSIGPAVILPLLRVIAVGDHVITDGYDPEQGQYYGRTYADSPEIDGRVWFTAKQAAPGTFCLVRLTQIRDGDLVGQEAEA